MNDNEHRTCLLCEKRMEVGARMVWAGDGWAHYACRFPDASRRAEARAKIENQQGTLFPEPRRTP